MLTILGDALLAATGHRPTDEVARRIRREQERRRRDERFWERRW
ncbi:hypothetical protein ACXN5S_01765 [Pseudoroseicyclus sp. H15]